MFSSVSSVDVSFTLTEDRVRPDVARVIFEGGSPDSYTGFLNFSATNVQECRNINVEVKVQNNSKFKLDS